MKYGLHIELDVVGTDDVGAAADVVVEQFAALERCHDGLLDFALGADNKTRSVEVGITVEAATPEEAVSIGLSSLRTAIHASGGGTPGWDDQPARDYVVAYTIDEKNGLEVRPLVDA